MTCYSPMFVNARAPGEGRQGAVRVGVAGKLYEVARYQVPCGRCIGCRIQRARTWAARIVAESYMHESSSFITLTFDDDHLPPGDSLDKRKTQRWIKRIRHHLPPLRYYLVGEYGDQSLRPHYHAVFFGIEFADKRQIARGRNPLYRSPQLESLWPYGYSSVGAVSYESAQYVAGYHIKKLSGARAAEYGSRAPEFALMSRRPGIGAAYVERYGDDIYSYDQMVLGRSAYVSRPPRYFDQRLMRSDRESYDRIKDAREVTPWHEMEAYKRRMEQAAYRLHTQRIRRNKSL